MPKTSQLDVIMQQLDALSIEELLAVRAKIDAMIVGTGYNNMMLSGHGIKAEDDSLEQVIQLVDEWMADESGYDEETYPQIEAALTQNRLSI